MALERETDLEHLRGFCGSIGASPDSIDGDVRKIQFITPLLLKG